MKGVVPTTAMLKKFVKTRNESGFNSNLQFQIDANASGFGLDALGKVLKFEVDGIIGYQWDVTVRDRDMPIRMIEFGRHTGLDILAEDVQLFELVKRKAKEVTTPPE